VREQIVVRRARQRHVEHRRDRGLCLGHRLGCLGLRRKGEPADERYGGQARRRGEREALGGRLARQIGRREHRGLGLEPLAHAGGEARRQQPRVAHAIADQVIDPPALEGLALAAQRVDRFPRGAPVELAVHQCRDVLFHPYHLLSFRVPSKGRNCSAIASRALKIRERTVPIGQSMTFAMSS